MSGSVSPTGGGTTDPPCFYRIWSREGTDGILRDQVSPVRVTKTTARRIYYVKHDLGVGHPSNVIGFVDRQEMEADGRVYIRNGTGSHYLYSSRPEINEGPARHTAEDVSRLKAEMAAAHPDRGGTAAGFIAARARYVKIRELVDAHA